MRHLTPDELIDVAEGTRPDSSVPHIVACDRCRRELADMRAMMRAAADVEVPEPSPLFWDHLSARVHDAISAERESRRSPAFGGWSAARAILPVSAAACAAIAVIIFLSVRVARAPETLPSAGGSFSVGPAPSASASFGDRKTAGDDPSLELVADLAADLTAAEDVPDSIDSANPAGFILHEGTVERAVTQLTEPERVELQRILARELKSSGD
jgi:hypothetical protein